jgi:hypothetical protein
MRLSSRDYVNLILSSGIFGERGNEYVVNNNLLQELSERLQPAVVIHITATSSSPNSTTPKESSYSLQLPADC